MRFNHAAIESSRSDQNNYSHGLLDKIGYSRFADILTVILKTVENFGTEGAIVNPR